MAVIWVINGPNINMIGIREPEIYGRTTYADLEEMIAEYGEKNSVEIKCFQSNHEGQLIDIIQSAYLKADGLVINPGGYTHTSIALLDALKAVGLPTVEVHISDITLREDFRKISYVRQACFDSIIGHGAAGYIEALDLLMERLESNES